ncbi:MAG: hypothetical protein EOO38_18515 [Cytophagaceae bacterium]|nr:MAG: hypothetical protein EOO38_18515 [Cytophagaceae bacterium]
MSAVSIAVSIGDEAGVSRPFQHYAFRTIVQLPFAKLFLFGTLLVERMTISILFDLPDSSVNRSLDFANYSRHRHHLKI